ncbi:MAG TPA: DNA topoisomerase IV subunit B, partial [Kofleriaceae bacterium]|nr:DNA topoisomerase IV subunit B [Kofleriaceae bacterium]
MAKQTYTGADIQVLEGLEPVRKRPAMYIGGTGKTGYHHLLWEIVDNSIDEVINKHATRVEITLEADGRNVIVEDNGRGIPVDMMAKHKKPALEVILTTLHSGGKFDRGKAYSNSGGLHGVGSSVVNALSSTMTATIKRDGDTYEQSFSRGTPTGPMKKLKKIGKAHGSGTRITFRPDEEIFGAKMGFDPKLIAERLETKSYLHRGVRIIFKDETQKPPTTVTYQHEEGIAEYLNVVIRERGKPPVPRDSTGFYLEESGEVGIELALQWTEATEEHIRSYVNGVPTPSGGTHENGFKAGLVRAVRNYVNVHKLAPKGVQLLSEDIREGLVAILSVYVADPQFQGQTKERLNNPEIAAPVDAMIGAALEKYLNINRSIAEAVVARVILSARARVASRAASQAVSRKSAVSHRLNLPGKLADCSSTDPDISELFIVEGDSAGGSAKQGRDRKTQAILPLRGKVLNTEQANLSKVLANKELSDIVSALGCGMGPKLDLSKLRYNRIFLLMDADADGHHISTLLLTFFYRHLKQLIDERHVYLAQPPLYRVDIGKNTYWALDDVDKERILATHGKGNAKANITRFKGLGEMSPDQLKQTTLDPKTRTSLLVTIPAGDELETEQLIASLMG